MWLFVSFISRWFWNIFKTEFCLQMQESNIYFLFYPLRLDNDISTVFHDTPKQINLHQQTLSHHCIVGFTGFLISFWFDSHSMFEHNDFNQCKGFWFSRRFMFVFNMLLAVLRIAFFQLFLFYTRRLGVLFFFVIFFFFFFFCFPVWWNLRLCVGSWLFSFHLLFSLQLILN